MNTLASPTEYMNPKELRSFVTSLEREKANKAADRAIAPIAGLIVLGGLALYATQADVVQARGLDLNVASKNRVTLSADDRASITGGDGGPNPDLRLDPDMNIKIESASGDEEKAAVLLIDPPENINTSIIASNGFDEQRGVGHVSSVKLANLDDPFLVQLDIKTINVLQENQAQQHQTIVPEGVISWIQFDSDGNKMSAQERRPMENRMGYMGVYQDFDGNFWVAGSSHEGKMGAIIPGSEANVLVGQLIVGEGENSGYLGLLDKEGTFQRFLQVTGESNKGYAVASVVVGEKNIAITRWYGNQTASLDSAGFTIGSDTETIAVDPDLRIELGEGMVESYNDMTIDFSNGTKLELEFASPEARAAIKDACNKAMYVAEQAGRLGSGSDGDINGTQRSFEDWMKKVDDNGGMMSGMYSLTEHPSGITVGQAIAIPGFVDMNKCSVVFHAPNTEKGVRPFKGAVALPGVWVSFGVSEEGGILINLAAMSNKNVYNFPYINNEVLTPQENAEAMSKIVALWVEDMNRLEHTKFDLSFVMGAANAGEPRRIDVNARGVDKDHLEGFMLLHPEAGTKWIKLAE